MQIITKELLKKELKKFVIGNDAKIQPRPGKKGLYFFLFWNFVIVILVK